MTIFVFYPPEKGDEGGFVLLKGDYKRVLHSFPFLRGGTGVTEWMLHAQDILTRLQI